jgi:hypothetical protein
MAQLARLTPQEQTSNEQSSQRVPEAEKRGKDRDVANGSEIRVRNRRYSEVLAIDSYSLRDRTPALRPDQVNDLTKVVNQIRPRLEGCFFTVDPPLAILPFLGQLVRVADQSHMSEAKLLWAIEDFLKSPVKEAFRAQQLSTWPEAVHWFILTFAAETQLDAAVRRLQTTTQGTTGSCCVWFVVGFHGGEVVVCTRSARTDTLIVRCSPAAHRARGGDAVVRVG